MRFNRAFGAWLFLGVLAPLSYAPPIQVTGTVRDFMSSHSDFEAGVSNYVPGMVGQSRFNLDGTLNDAWTNASNLAGKNPTYKLGGGAGSVASAASFQDWFNDVPANMSQDLSLTLQDMGAGIYQYSSNSFFPIDNQMFGNENNSHNYHFTYELNLQFTYEVERDNVFSFSGDDDVWVYINNILVIDLGGVHGAMGASVDLDNYLGELGLADNGTYDIDIYFAERHTTQSNFTMTTSLALGGGNTNVVPEPVTLSLMGMGAAAYIRKRRLSAKKS